MQNGMQDGAGREMTTSSLISISGGISGVTGAFWTMDVVAYSRKSMSLS